MRMNIVTVAIAAALFTLFVAKPIAGSEDGAACSMCQDAISGVEHFLEANSTVQGIVKALDDICNLLPASKKQKCLAEIQSIAPKLAESDESIVTKYSPFALCTMLSQCQVECCATPLLPEQIHLSITNDVSEMVVMWSTLQETPAPTVQYGLSSDSLTFSANATVSSYTSGGWIGSLYTAKMTGLKPNTTYYYRVGDPTEVPDYWMKPAWSQVPSLHFTTRIPPARKTHTRVAVLGDAGATDASMLSLTLVARRVLQKDIDFVLHDGDIGYADGYQPLWDQYVRKIENIAGFVPYMTVQGNHEGFFDFKPYMARFSMPYKQSGSPSPLYYSFDYGSVHYTALNSESEMGLFPRTVTPDDDMYKWLENDLKAANASRHRQPWIIVMLHRPLYCTENNKDCDAYADVLRKGFEDLFYSYGVDLVIQAHRHNYQVTYPVYQQQKVADDYKKPPAPVYIVNGATGNKEHLMGPGQRPWSRMTLKQYGYGMLDINGADTLTWTYHAAADDSVLDTFTIKK